MTPLAVENATKTFRQGDRRVTALAGVSLSVEQGQFLAIMGASGSGKSTLLHLMAGLTSPDSGRILIDGQDITHMRDRELTVFRRRHVGLVFQAFNLIPTLTAGENMALPLMLEGRNGSAVANRIDGLLETLGLSHRREHRPDVMSGGEQQRVAIGRALAADPAVILADEPTGNLDSTNSDSVCELLRNLSAEHGKTIVMVTHEPSVAIFARQVGVMKDGRLIAQFATSEVAGAQELAVKYQACLRAEGTEASRHGGTK
ncbi:MAG: ABC transporter ATP-binding protein [Tepidisphaeraceae bacterium]|jgi:putative ABC transport system ATP-binding protein